jgi:hypothetical protein
MTQPFRIFESPSVTGGFLSFDFSYRTIAMDNVIDLAARRFSAKRPLTYSKVIEDSNSLCSYFLMLIEQVGNFCSGFSLDLPNSHPTATVQRTIKELSERGYPCRFAEGGERHFGVLVFQ